MKLHLPKLLRVAVIAAITCVTIQPVMGANVILTASDICGPEDDETTDGEVEGTRYLDVYYKEGVAGNQKIDVSYNNYVWEGNLVVGDIIENNIVASQGDVNKVGGIKKNNSTWTLVAPDANLAGFKFTNNFTVKGDLTVQGDGEIVLGGQPAQWDYSKNKYKNGPTYTGLEVTGKLAVTGGSLKSTKIITNDLTITDGIINTHTGNCSSGNSGLYASSSYGKQSTIKNSLTQEGGEAIFGYTSKAQGIGNEAHCYVGFGTSEQSATITQTGGRMLFASDIAARGGLEIEQSTPKTGETTQAMIIRDCLWLVGGGWLGTSALDKPTSIVQNSNIALLEIGKFASSKDVAHEIDISQTGTGTINLVYGSSFKKSGVITLNQSGGGFINIGGGHSDDVFNTTYKSNNDVAINAQIDNEHYAIKPLHTDGFTSKNTTYVIKQSSGTINIFGKGDVGKRNGVPVTSLAVAANIQCSEATIGANLNISEDAVMKAEILNLSSNSKLSNKGILVAGTDEVVAEKEVLNVTDEGTLNLDDGYGSATHAGAIKDVQMSGGKINYKGAVVLDSVDVKGGTLNLTDSGANLTIGSLAVAAAVSKGVCLTADTVGTETSAPLTIADSGSWTMGTNSTFALSFTDNYLGTIDSLADATTEAVDFKFTELVATGTVDTDKLTSTFELAGMSAQWTLGSAEWTQDSGKTYVSGVLVYDAWIDVDDGGTFADSVQDETPELKTGLSISEKDVTLTGDNKHTLGTKIDGGDTGITVTLGHANALGAGEVSTTGKTTLTTTSKVTADLNVVISNSGALTLDGSYDVGTLADNSGVVIPAGYVAADGDVTADGNGFRRVEGYTVQVVDNDAANGATLTGGDNLKLKDGTLEGVLDEATGVVTFGAGVDYSTYRMVEAVEESAQAIIDASVDASGPQVEKVAMTAGTLKVDASITVNAKGGTVKLQEETAGPVTVSGCLENTTVESAGGTISADITGTSSVAVTGDTTLSGTNSYSGRTVIDGAVLKLEAGSSVGDGAVELKNHGTFDMGDNALSNAIKVTGCTLRGAGYYTGDMEVHDELELGNPTTANKVTLLGGGSLTGSDLTVNELDVQTDGDASVGGSLTINDNGTITLNNGKVLSVGGSLTLAGATTLTLNGNYAVGTELLSSTGTLTMDLEAVTLVYDDSTVELEQQGNALVLVSKFKQDKADIAAQGNWGIATASRAFVNTVRGQHSNTGCIADGRGTVWAAAFGAYNDLDGSDIDVKGAAVGVDAKVGSCSTVGIAFGYAEGEVSPTGLRDADQEGEYVALYGSHGLKKLSSTSCLSLDWVAAYGNTESEWNSLKWEQDSLQLNTRLNWNKKVTERLGMSVFGGLEYFATGSDTADGVKSGSIQNLRGEIGVGARYVAWGTPASQPVLDEKGATLAAARPGCEKLVLNGEIRYFNDMVRSNPVIEMDGLRGGGENPGRQGMGIEAGATYRISERWSASANYSFNAMEDSVEHRANVGASYTF